MIFVNGISKSFDGVRVVDNVRLEARAETPVVIVGPSGSGKTTLLRLIAGLEMPDCGEIHIGGRLASDSFRLLAPSLRNIGFVFQSPALWPHLTLAQNVRFGCRSGPRQARVRVQELIEQMGLSGLANRYPNQVSGGEARRAALARALAGRPKCLLMDEPLTHLDPELKTEMIALIRNVISTEQATLVYVTHDRTEAVHLSDRPLLMLRGRLQQAYP